MRVDFHVRGYSTKNFETLTSPFIASVDPQEVLVLMVLSLHGALGCCLCAEREINFYGDGKSGLPTQTFHSFDAARNNHKSEEVLNCCHEFIDSTEASY